MHQAILLATLASTVTGAVIPPVPLPINLPVAGLWQRANPWSWWPFAPSTPTTTTTKPSTSTKATSTSTSKISVTSIPATSVTSRLSVTSALPLSTLSVSASISASLSASVSASVGASSSTSAGGAAATLPPKVQSTSYLANVTDPNLDRDSCVSARIGGRVLWSCRDTQVWNTATNQDQLPLIQNTAGWTDWSASSGPVITPGSQAPRGCASAGNNIYQMSGQTTGNPVPYYALGSDMCPTSGLCSDNSRWVYWPDSPPLITTNQTASSTSATGYSWVDKKHLSGLTVVNTNPPFTLFKTSWSGGSALPSVSVVQDQFWKQEEVGFGSYGSVIRNGYAYLYGQTTGYGTLLARVLTGSIEDRSAYQYYYQGTWSATMPSITNTDSVIPNAGAGGQGTFYYSSYYGAYLWIGQQLYDTSANFYLSYAKQPEGPWSARQLIFQGQNAVNSTFGAYSLQAHPALLPSNTASESGIYLTWTIPNNAANSGNGAYITPLVYLKFQ